MVDQPDSSGSTATAGPPGPTDARAYPLRTRAEFAAQPIGTDFQRRIRSYTRRGMRLSPRHANAWAKYAPDWVVPIQPTGTTIPAGQASGSAASLSSTPVVDWPKQFGRCAPLIVEVGSGNGEAIVALAQSYPEANIVGIEVWKPGLAATLSRLAAGGIENVRLVSQDANWMLQHGFEPHSLSQVWTFFPDPWPKKRHHKRRLVSHSFAELVASRLAAGGWWRLATDWAPYVEQIHTVIGAQPELTGGVTPRWQRRPVTKFERRGIAAGHQVVDLAYRRR